jgi:2-methylisocitrate lyase-like PEP mutase family enzyme
MSKQIDSRQIERAKAFTALHVKGNPVILFNVWDAGSALAVAKAGAKALATGSWSVAAAHGFGDGEALPFDLSIANIARIVQAVDLPVSIDLEAGYGASPEAVVKSVTGAATAGAIGFNLEDRIVGQKALYSTEDQVARLRAARAAADRIGIPLVINARNDHFLSTDAATHDAALLDQALARADAYAKAGATSFFAPGLVDPALIGKLCASAPLPVNIMVFPGVPTHKHLAELGVARISHGPAPYRQAMQSIESAARAAFQSLAT